MNRTKASYTGWRTSAATRPEPLEPLGRLADEPGLGEVGDAVQQRVELERRVAGPAGRVGGGPVVGHPLVEGAEPPRGHASRQVHGGDQDRVGVGVGQVLDEVAEPVHAGGVARRPRRSTCWRRGAGRGGSSRRPGARGAPPRAVRRAPGPRCRSRTRARRAPSASPSAARASRSGSDDALATSAASDAAARASTRLPRARCESERSSSASQRSAAGAADPAASMARSAHRSASS